MTVPPAPADYWVFGYGSLMWDPGFPYDAALPGLLVGYHRQFCLYSYRYRGTRERPGLVLGLDRGGSCRGVVYRVPDDAVAATKAYLWERELGIVDRGLERVAARVRTLVDAPAPA